MNYVNIDTNNKTKIVATKQVVENLRTNEAIRNFLISIIIIVHYIYKFQ